MQYLHLGSNMSMQEALDEFLRDDTPMLLEVEVDPDEIS